MLEKIMSLLYDDVVYTSEKELFYKVYKKHLIFTVVRLRLLLTSILFSFISIVWFIFIKPRIYGFIFLDIAMLFLLLNLIEIRKKIINSKSGKKTRVQIRTKKIELYLKRFLSKHNKAISKKDWKKIKKHSLRLYNDLLSEECEHCCYYYSLEIARILKDCTLIWGAAEEPFEKGNKFYAHAVVLKGDYIYDSNMHFSIKYEDFVKLYKFKIYKKWSFDEFSKENFRDSERNNFRNWCKANHVLLYERF